MLSNGRVRSRSAFTLVELGYLARTDDLSDASMRRAMIHGSAMGSFVVEGFSVTRLLEINAKDIARRVAEFHELVSFEKQLPA